MPLDLDAIDARLPKGYRARGFRDGDREPLVALRNAEVHPMERQDADEWRDWERIQPDPTQEQLTLEGPDGAVLGRASVGRGGFPAPDGALFGGVSVAAAARRKGIGTVLLEAIEAVARERSAPRLLGGASDAQPFALEWAAKRGYRELGRRIESYIELASFEPARYGEPLERTRAHGIRYRTFADELAGSDEAAREDFFRAIWEAEAPMWDDVPFPTPLPHPPYETFRRLLTKLVPDASVVAYDGRSIAGFTYAGARGKDDAYTFMTGVAREHRGEGIAQALKIASLAGAKARGMRAMLTTNDEPNKAMRGINAKLGYQMLPAWVQLEKALA